MLPPDTADYADFDEPTITLSRRRLYEAFALTYALPRHAEKSLDTALVSDMGEILFGNLAYKDLAFHMGKK